MQISPRAVDLYVAMGKLKCTCLPPAPTWQEPCPGCARWYDLHADLHDELQLPPWQWPCIGRRSPKRAGSPTMNETIAATMRLLEEAVKARRRAAANPGESPLDVAAARGGHA
jgi:hypothetical protein